MSHMHICTNYTHTRSLSSLPLNLSWMWNEWTWKTCTESIRSKWKKWPFADKWKQPPKRKKKGENYWIQFQRVYHNRLEIIANWLLCWICCCAYACQWCHAFSEQAKKNPHWQNALKRSHWNGTKGKWRNECMIDRGNHGDIFNKLTNKLEKIKNDKCLEYCDAQTASNSLQTLLQQNNNIKRIQLQYIRKKKPTKELEKVTKCVQNSIRKNNKSFFNCSGNSIWSKWFNWILRYYGSWNSKRSCVANSIYCNLQTKTMYNSNQKMGKKRCEWVSDGHKNRIKLFAEC